MLASVYYTTVVSLLQLPQLRFSDERGRLRRLNMCVQRVGSAWDPRGIRRGSARDPRMFYWDPRFAAYENQCVYCILASHGVRRTDAFIKEGNMSSKWNKVLVALGWVCLLEFYRRFCLAPRILSALASRLQLPLRFPFGNVRYYPCQTDSVSYRSVSNACQIAQ